MSTILEKVQNVDANSSDAVKEVLVAFIQNLSKHTETDCNRWLRTLEHVVNRFPKYCMSHRNSIETHIKHFLDSSNHWSVIEAAQCAHVLQQVRPTQEKTATAKSCWRDQMNMLCNAVHSLVGVIFANSVDIYKIGDYLQKSDTENTSSSTVLAAVFTQIAVVKNSRNDKAVSDAKLNILCTRLGNVFIFIQAMLVEVYPVAKPVRPQVILNIIIRTLSVSSSTDASQNFGQHVATVKTEALRTLDALIVCLGPNLIPYSSLVFKSLMLTLRWSSEHSNDESGKVRCQTYDSLSLWLTTLQCNVPDRRTQSEVGKSFEYELAENIIKDVTPVKHVVQLTMSNQSTKNLSKKAKRKLANTMLQQSGIAGHMPSERNKITASDQTIDDTAVAALKCAEVLLTVSGIFLHRTIYELILNNLIRECYELESYSEKRSFHLLRALEACRKATRPDAPYAAKYCLPLYCRLSSSRYKEVAKMCQQGNLDIRMQLQGAPPSLLFQVESKNVDCEPEVTRKEMSAANVAFLETTTESISYSPTETPSDNEIITIPCETLKKKTRLEIEETDHVSVSSKNSVTLLDSESENSLDCVDNIVETVVVIPVQHLECVSQGDKENNEEIQLNNEKVNTNNTSAVSSNDSITGVNEMDSQKSLMVTYDSPEAAKRRVPVLEKLDGDEPCYSDDDVLMVCGQGHKSPDGVVDNSAEMLTVDAIQSEETLNNNEIIEIEVAVGNKPKGDNSDAAKSNTVSVEDMMADFVDEVTENVDEVTKN